MRGLTLLLACLSSDTSTSKRLEVSRACEARPCSLPLADGPSTCIPHAHQQWHDQSPAHTSLSFLNRLCSCSADGCQRGCCFDSAQLAGSEYLACGRGAVAAGKGLPLQVLQLLRLAHVARPDAHGGPGLQSAWEQGLTAGRAKPQSSWFQKAAQNSTPLALSLKVEICFPGVSDSHAALSDCWLSGVSEGLIDATERWERTLSMTSSSAGLYDSLALSSRAEDLIMLPLVGALAETGPSGCPLCAPSPGDSCRCTAPRSVRTVRATICARNPSRGCSKSCQG